jgi:hypothetical protein
MLRVHLRFHRNYIIESGVKHHIPTQLIGIISPIKFIGFTENYDFIIVSFILFDLICFVNLEILLNVALNTINLNLYLN